MVRRIIMQAKYLEMVNVWLQACLKEQNELAFYVACTGH